MALSFKPSKFYRYTSQIFRLYSEDKTIYQRLEEGPKPREVHGQPYPEWRKPWVQRKGEWTSKLSIFIEKSPNPDIINALSKAPNLTWQQVKDWYKEMEEIQEIVNQKFLPERISALGSNLAAVHFFTYRNAAVRYIL